MSTTTATNTAAAGKTMKSGTAMATTGTNPIINDDVLPVDVSDRSNHGREAVSTTTRAPHTSSMTKIQSHTDEHVMAPVAPIAVTCVQNSRTEKSNSSGSGSSSPIPTRNQNPTTMMMKNDDPTKTDASILCDGTGSVRQASSSSSSSKGKPPVISVTEEAIRNIHKEHLKQLDQLLQETTTHSSTTMDVKSQRTSKTTTPMTSFPSYLRNEYRQLQQQYDANQQLHSDLEYINMLQVYRQQQLYYQQYCPPNALIQPVVELNYGDTHHQGNLTMTSPSNGMLVFQKPNQTRRRRRCGKKALQTTSKKGRTDANRLLGSTPTSKPQPGTDMAQVLLALSNNDIAGAVQCLQIPPPNTEKHDHQPIRMVPRPPKLLSSSMWPETPREQKGVQFTSIPILPKTVLSPQIKHTLPRTITSICDSISTYSANETAPSITVAPSTTPFSSLMYHPTVTPVSSNPTNRHDLTRRSTNAMTPMMRHIAVVSPPNCGSVPFGHDHPIGSIRKHQASRSYEPGTKILPASLENTYTTTNHHDGTSAFISYNTLNDMNYENGTDNVNDWNNDLYTDLLYTEEILSLSDSHHSHQSCLTNDDDDEMLSDSWGNDATMA